MGDIIQVGLLFGRDKHSPKVVRVAYLLPSSDVFKEKLHEGLLRERRFVDLSEKWVEAVNEQGHCVSGNIRDTE